MAKVVTLGCRLNQYDSARLRRILEASGQDIVVLNTCTVTQKAENEVRKTARQIRRQHPGCRLIVMGCAVRSSREQLKKVEEIDFLADGEKELLQYLGITPENLVVPCFGERTRAFVKVQEGCDRWCSYCIVPQVRGPSRSRTLEEVEREFEGIIGGGYREIVITGTHIADFGRGLEEKASLPVLLRRLLEKGEGYRLRLSSIEMSSIGDELIEVIRESRGRVCEHLHIPVQSASPKVLKEMNREQDTEELKSVIRKLQKEIPGIGIGADIMCAFPTESDDDFMETVKFVKEMPIAFLHVFTYSRRPGTVAFQFMPVHKEVAEARKEEMLRLARRKRLEFYERERGKVVNSLTLEGGLEERGKALAGNFIEFYTEKKYEPNNFIDFKLDIDAEGEPFGVEA